MATAIAELAEPDRIGFPIDSQHPYLAKIITRRYPRDLSLVLKKNRGSTERISSANEHIACLAVLVIDAYKNADWEPLSDCFAYADMMSEDLLALLRQGFLEKGDPASFANVFINAGQDIFCEWPQSIRNQIIQRILVPDSNVAGVVANLKNKPVRVIRDEHPDAFARISERVWEAGAPRSILRVLANRLPDSNSESDVGIWKLIAQLDTFSLCIAISMREFFDLLFPVVSIPMSPLGTSRLKVREAALEGS